MGHPKHGVIYAWATRPRFLYSTHSGVTCPYTSDAKRHRSWDGCTDGERASGRPAHRANCVRFRFEDAREQSPDAIDVVVLSIRSFLGLTRSWQAGPFHLACSIACIE